MTLARSHPDRRRPRHFPILLLDAHIVITLARTHIVVEEREVHRLFQVLTGVDERIVLDNVNLLNSRRADHVDPQLERPADINNVALQIFLPPRFVDGNQG